MVLVFNANIGVMQKTTIFRFVRISVAMCKKSFAACGGEIFFMETSFF